MAIQKTAVWRIGPSGNDANGGGFDASISGAGTDYSRQNAAQISGTAGTAAGTTAFSDAGATFTSAMVGNAIQIASGSGFTAGFYFVTGYTDATHVTLDRSPGTGSAAVWKLGGRWQYSGLGGNLQSGPQIGGNIIYLLGAGTPNPASYSYDYTNTGYKTFPNGNGDGRIVWATDPDTPGWTGLPGGGQACISTDGLWIYSGAYIEVRNLYFVAQGTSFQNLGVINGGQNLVRDCVFDMNGQAMPFVAGGTDVLGCKIFNSGTAQNIFVLSVDLGYHAIGNNLKGSGYLWVVGGGNLVFSNKITGCPGPGIYVDTIGYGHVTIANNTVDGNAGHGIEIGTQNSLLKTKCFGNIISNHTGSGKYGITCDAGTLADNKLMPEFIDFNCYYNNTTNYNAIPQGANDSVGVDPQYTNSSTDDFSIGTNLRALGYPRQFP